MGSPASAAVQRDRAALVALYAATAGAIWKDNTNWLSDVPLDEWYGVTTDVGGRVTILSLAGNHLAGPLPGEWGCLRRLEELDLAANGLVGKLPAVWGRLTHLTKMYLWGNNLTGPLPAAWGGLGKIEWLDLADNCLTGVLPRNLTGLTALQGFHFDHTELCVPCDDAFSAWLRSIEDVRGGNC